MKNINKILIWLIVSIFSFTYLNIAYADWITTIVPEKVPWAICSVNEPNDDWSPKNYKCTVEKWFWSVITMLWNIIKYFTYIASLWAILFIVFNWIMYSMSWIEQSMKDDAKKRIIWTIVWLILLLLSWVILNTIAPWIYK